MGRFNEEAQKKKLEEQQKKEEEEKQKAESMKVGDRYVADANNAGHNVNRLRVGIQQLSGLNVKILVRPQNKVLSVITYTHMHVHTHTHTCIHTCAHAH